jgi:type 1 glutamine amidotransferase
MPSQPARAHVITGGFPPGAYAGHDHDYARLRLLEMLRDAEVPCSVGNDFHDVANWLDRSRLLITYTAGPFPDEAQNAAIRSWIEGGGRWIGLHGTSGGRAVRISETQRRRRMLKGAFHETLGGFFLNHPPIRKFTVTVEDRGSPITRDLPESFDVIDEPYMIEVQQPESCRFLLTNALGPDPSPEGFGFVYDEDTSLRPDGKTRVLGYSKDLGAGGVTYIALGHCHTPWSNSQPFVDKSVDPEGKTPLTLRGPWEEPAFERLLRNAIAWGVGASA